MEIEEDVVRPQKKAEWEKENDPEKLREEKSRVVIALNSVLNNFISIGLFLYFAWSLDQRNDERAFTSGTLGFVMALISLTVFYSQPVKNRERFSFFILGHYIWLIVFSVLVIILLCKT